MFELSLPNFLVFNIANHNHLKNVSLETFWDSIKLAWNSTYVDAMVPRDAVNIKPKSNTDHSLQTNQNA